MIGGAPNWFVWALCVVFTLLWARIAAVFANKADPKTCLLYTSTLGGETEGTDYMVNEMVQWMALALPFVYLVMVAQFQSMLSPFIVLFTVPLAFTGGLLGLLVTGQQLTMISLMGFIVLMGTVVNLSLIHI